MEVGVEVVLVVVEAEEVVEVVCPLPSRHPELFRRDVHRGMMVLSHQRHHPTNHLIQGQEETPNTHSACVSTKHA
jgi:hypothetical protein